MSVIQGIIDMFAGGEDGQKMVKGTPINYTMNSGNTITKTPMIQSLTDFDMNDPESVKALQKRLGVTPDGMFGPKTEEAYRLAVNEERKLNDQETLKYDYNPEVQGQKKFQPFGGLLRQAYSDFDKKVMKGKLPGGYSDENIMSAEEFYNK